MAENQRYLNIVITGFMSTGKTTVGELVADQLGWQFVDTDDLIVERAGMSIPEIFLRHGEDMFRAYEAQLAPEIALWQRVVIATGGGMLVDPDNLAALREHGLVICLTASEDEIESRLGDGAGRPLAPDWRNLRAKRREAYARIPHQIDTTGRDPQNIAKEIIHLWQKSR